jgi:hypothetical protein
MFYENIYFKVLQHIIFHKQKNKPKAQKAHKIFYDNLIKFTRKKDFLH